MNMSYSQSASTFIFYFSRRHCLPFLFLIASFAIWAISDAIFPYLFKEVIDHLTAFHENKHAIFSVLR